MRAGPLLVLVLVLLASGPALAGEGEREMTPAWVPTEGVARVLVDGVITVPPSSSAPSAYNKLQAALLNRQATGTPYEVALNLTRGADGLLVQADWIPTPLPAPANVTFSFRLVTLGQGDPRFHTLATAAPSVAAREGGGWRTEALLKNAPEAAGVIVTAQNAGNESPRFETDEVVQSAAWAPGDPARIRQASKSVHFEYERPESCDACGATDEALRLLSKQRGWPDQSAPTGESYRSASAPWKAGLGLTLGACTAALLLRRRA